MSPLRKSLVFASLLGYVTGQTTAPHTFNWGLTTITGNTINQCDTISLLALALNGGGSPGASDGVPPYTMNSFAPGFPSTRTVVGSNPAALSWTVAYPAGTQLFLSMVDSVNHQGGVAFFTVAAGTSSSCLPQGSTSNFRVTANATSLNTCDPLQVMITGGTKPYTISIIFPGANENTAALGPNDDIYTWINRALPNEHVVVSAQDASGQSSIATTLINTGGSNDATCGGRQSFSGNSQSNGGNSTGTGSAPEPSNSSSPGNGNAAPKNNNLGIIVGAAAGGATFLIAALLAFFCLRRRRGAGTERIQVDLDGHIGRGKTVRDTMHYSSVRPGSPTLTDTPNSQYHGVARQTSYGPGPGSYSANQRFTMSESQYSGTAPQSPYGAGYAPYGRPPSQVTDPFSQAGSQQWDNSQYGSDPTARRGPPSSRLSSAYPDTSSGSFASGPRPVSSVPESRTSLLASGARDEAGAYRPRLVVANAGRSDDTQPTAVPLDKQSKIRGMAAEEAAPAPIVRHTDAGAAPIELPPAYGEQQEGSSSSGLGPASGSAAAAQPEKSGKWL